MANLRFKKVGTLPTTGLQEGDVLFVKSNSTVYVTEKKSATDPTLVNTPFWGGIVKNARMKKASADASEARVLEISYMDSTPALEIDFSDIASSSDISAKLNALSTRITAAQTRADNAYNLAAGKISDVNGSEAIVVTGDKTKTVGLALNNAPANTVELTQSAPAGGGSAVTGGLSANVKVSVLKPQLDLVGADEKVLSYAGGFVKSDITMSYDNTDKKIYLYGKDKTKAKALSTIDCTSFVKDGMLEGSALYKATAATGEVTINGKKYNLTGLTANRTYIVLVWNTDSAQSPMTIDVTSLIDVYTAGTGLTLTGNTFSITGGTVDSQITNRLNALDASPSGTSNEVTVKVTQTDGKLTGVVVTAPDTAAMRNSLNTLREKKLKGIATGGNAQEILLGNIPSEGLDMSGNNTLLAAKGTTLPDKPAAYSSPVATDTVTQAILKVDKGVAEAKAAASSAASSGVTKFAGQTGEIKIDGTGAGSYPVKLSMATDKTLKAAVSGLGTAAAKNVGDFATKAQGDKADNSVQYDVYDVNINDGGLTVYGQITSKHGCLQLGADAQTSYDITVQSSEVDDGSGGIPALKFSEGANDVILTGVGNPLSNNDAANKAYVDTKVAASVSSAMTWTIFE